MTSPVTITACTGKTEYEPEQENNQMTNFLHLKINIGNNNLTLGIYHTAVETHTHPQYIPATWKKIRKSHTDTC
jgi:hypothetical protein